jgi:hypothetical protein
MSLYHLSPLELLFPPLNRELHRPPIPSPLSFYEVFISFSSEIPSTETLVKDPFFSADRARTPVMRDYWLTPQLS